MREGRGRALRASGHCLTSANVRIPAACSSADHKRVLGGQREPTSRYLGALTSVKCEAWGSVLSLRQVFISV
jgi:hypothetical protein